jgi:hypothetical protein
VSLTCKEVEERKRTSIFVILKLAPGRREQEFHQGVTNQLNGSTLPR